eukprot:CAMPEP_0114228004 /NCGR_PEP_ID=MMETSP0058-20121206/2102_1 /TAXON_ID=36894 /ORGANISM="Pyramimonas parkeae, CCMP726" /LENGTH=272 /DNA_ID=CAMNT_0001338903 /DNA_START=324 /DNA_END=1142 /DNA_ORIENTATION=+
MRQSVVKPERPRRITPGLHASRKRVVVPSMKCLSGNPQVLISGTRASVATLRQHGLFGISRNSRRAILTRAGNGNDLSPAAKRVDMAAKGFRKLGVCSFWSQLILTVVSSVIVVFAILYRTATQVHKEAGLYLTLFGLLMGFLSTFWAFGYTRLAAKLRQGVQDPEQTPPRAEVLKSLSSGITINLVGLASTLFGLEATCGLLFAKSLAFAASNPYTISQSNPVQALDIFVVQASANTLLSHFIALCFSLWLLRMITFGSESPPTISESTST